MSLETPERRSVPTGAEVTDEIRALMERRVTALPAGVAVDIAALLGGIEATELSDGRRPTFGPPARLTLMLHAVHVRRGHPR